MANRRSFTAHAALVYLLFIGAVSTGCYGPEPFSEEDYYLRNEGSEVLRVEATHGFGDDPVMLINDVVPPGETTHIHHVTEGSGGHTYPSNFFGTFTVRADERVVYEGVVDEDWTIEDDLGLVLTLPR